MATLRELLQDGRPAIGGWCSIPSPVTAEIVGRSGFDWVCIDTQHGLIGYDQMVPMLQALSATGTPVLVRVPWNRPEHVMKALDAGAHGIIVPMVNTADEAARAVEAAKYPPGGTRSWGPLRAAMAAPSYSAPEANRRTFVAVMIETPEGMRNMTDILAVPGVGAIYVGPSDLGISHGMRPDLAVRDTDHEELVRTVLRSCQRAGVHAGIHCDSPRTAQRWLDLGFQLTSLSSDAELLHAAARTAAQQLRTGSGDDSPGRDSPADND